MLITLLNNLFNRKSQRTNRRGVARVRSGQAFFGRSAGNRRAQNRLAETAPPVSERLEDRTLLSAVSWDGGAGTFNWADANN